MILGETNTNSYGTPMKIIRISNHQDIDVEFLDDYHYVKIHKAYSNFRVGNIKNPYDKTVCGVGYIGVGEYLTHKSNGNSTEEYNVWLSMLERCYNEKHKDRHKAYYGIAKCCNEWLSFQNFAEWYKNNRYECNERLHLDKDILYPGNKIYSPYHCLLVPQRINMLFLNKANKRGLPNGISKVGNRYCAKYNNKELGAYDTLEEAYTIYANEKKQAIVSIANEYREGIPEYVYKALLDYEVRIENDKNYVE